MWGYILNEAYWNSEWFVKLSVFIEKGGRGGNFFYIITLMLILKFEKSALEQNHE